MISKQRVQQISISVFMVVCAAGSYIGYMLVQRQYSLAIRLDELEQLKKQHIYTKPKEEYTPSTEILEKMVTSSQLWRPIQEQVRDTVVQIFSHISAIDILRPYAPPHQAQATGSGFFINDEGYLITNAHVVNEAQAMWIQIPSLGRRIIDVELISISPARDLALLKVTDKGLKTIRDELGSVPFLDLGDSDALHRSDEILALGYPLGQNCLKSTTGVVSGRQQHLIQMSAAINPGSSGGPLLNTKGQVVGINSSGVVEAQNVGYAIPVNVLKTILPDLHKVKLLRKPFLGVLFSSSTKAAVEYLGNPQPGGCYVVEVIPGSTLDKAGVQRGDMIYELNGFTVDRFGEMNVPWSEDKESITQFVNRLSIGETVSLVVYRNGKRMTMSVKFDYASLPSIRHIYPGYEDIDYEIFGGMVVMELNKNHMSVLKDRAPGLSKFLEFKNQGESVLIVTEIFSNSQLYRSRTISVGTTLNEVNGIEVHTLEDFRRAIKHASGSDYLVLLASDNVNRSSDNIFVVLSMAALLDEEEQLSRTFKYPITETTREILRVHKASEAVRATA